MFRPYDKAKKYLQKALVIAIEIGDRKGEGSYYGSLGAVFQLCGQYDNAKKYLQKALVIAIEIDDRKGEDHITEAWVLCSSSAGNTTRLKSISK